MKRRTFVSGASGLITGYIAASQSAHAESSAVAEMERSSRIFDSPASPQPATGQPHFPRSAWQLQDLFVMQSKIYFLYNNLEAHIAYLGAADSDGNLLWRQPLPKGTYLGISSSLQDATILVHARGYKGYESSILRFSPHSGAISLVGMAPMSGSGFCFAGDSMFAGFTVSGLNLCRVTNGIPGITPVPLGALSGVAARMQVLPDNLLAVVSLDGRSLAFIQTETMAERTLPLVSQDIDNAGAYYKKYAQEPKVNPTIVVATGMAAGSSSLAVLISPFFKKIAKVVLIDKTTGNATSSLNFALPPLGPATFAVPCRIVSNQNETGIVFSNGSIAWYKA